MGRDYLFVLMAACMWGTLRIFAKYLDGLGLDTFTMVFYRVLFAPFLLEAYLKITGIGFFS